VEWLLLLFYYLVVLLDGSNIALNKLRGAGRAHCAF
jgi:hypothetical protein